MLLHVLIFDGEICVWTDGNVKDTSEVLFRNRYRSRHYIEDLMVSVVEKSHFGKYLVGINRSFDTIADIVYQKKDALDEQARVILKEVKLSG